jgi:hypothetical protein
MQTNVKEEQPKSFFQKYKFELLTGSIILILRFGTTAYRAYKMRVKPNTILELDLDSLLREKVIKNFFLT